MGPVNWRNVVDRLKVHRLSLLLADRLGRGRGRARFLDKLYRPPMPVERPDLSGWEDAELAAILIGHATVLLRIGGMTILTDPVYSNRVGLGFGLVTAGPARRTPPAIPIRELPPLDLILISHAHFDHLDRPTLIRLPRSTPVVTAHRLSDLVADLGYRNITELRWGESIDYGSMKLTACRTCHWGARAFYDDHRGYGGYLMETSRRRVLFAGDTAYCDYFRPLGKVDLAIFGISAYDPYVQAHATPEQVWDMVNQVRAEHVLPMHYGTFRLSHEPMDEPMERLLAAAGNDVGRIVTTKIGGQWRLS